MHCHMVINGLPVDAVFTEKNVREIFVPLLRRLTALSEAKKRRILVYLAAPPGAGKSTMAEFLRRLSLKEPGLRPVTVIGMDGFHRRQEYLLEHTVIRDGKTVRMVDIKGAPMTFDLDLFKEALRRAAAREDCAWPEYDRLLHDPVYRELRVTGDIVLLEGNYLLLEEDGWKELRSFADYTIRITADPDLLRERLVNRKAASGMDREKAEQFVDFSDLSNARLCLERSSEADLELRLLADDSYVIV